jgi:hypothetical protein
MYGGKGASQKVLILFDSKMIFRNLLIFDTKNEGFLCH